MRTAALKTTVALLVCACVAACAPAPGRATVTYDAEPRDVIATLARRSAAITPPDGYDHFSVETIGESSVTLRADPVLGVSIVGFVAGVNTEPARVTVTTFAEGRETIVVISVFPSRLEAVYESVVALLDETFGRTLSLPGGGSIKTP